MSGRLRRLRPVLAGLALLLVLVLGTLAYLASRGPEGPSAAAEDAPDDVVQQALRAGKPTVVEFGADNCSSCRQMKPVLAQLARQHGEQLNVLDINLLQHGGYVSRYKIMLMPTQVFYDAQGREIGRHMGKIGADEILARLGLPLPGGGGRAAAPPQ